MKALLCTGRLDTFSGSELVIIEFGQELRRRKFDVHVYAHHIAAPLDASLRTAGLIPKSGDDIDLTAYDLIYTQQNALSLLLDAQAMEQLCEVGLPYILFAHLSPYIEIEAPLSRLESEIATHIIANSVETRKALAAFGAAYRKAIVVPNPTQDAYISHTPINAIRKILIVSNHCPDEVLAARELLISAGYTVDHLGEGGNVTMMRPEILHDCDAVMTIGKTVQMAILAHRPVYCYDHFGGPGWLTDENYQMAAALNFSGRDQPVKKTAMEIFEEVTHFKPVIPQFYRKQKPFLMRFWVDLLLRDLKYYRRKVPKNRDAMKSFARLDRCMSVVCSQAFNNHFLLRYVLPRKMRFIADRDKWIRDRDEWIRERDAWIRERDDLIRDLQLQIHDRDHRIKESHSLIRSLHEQLTSPTFIRRCVSRFLSLFRFHTWRRRRS
ncbi:hypothetical protein CGLAMM_09675 [Acetobacteraceae bacterium EV16G]|uniref:Glycosyltransferase n=1 Tax=Sorlinia euscelidii TaxID=3081148 RepID=A0ABU7U3M1_9PROT